MNEVKRSFWVGDILLILIFALSIWCIFPFIKHIPEDNMITTVSTIAGSYMWYLFDSYKIKYDNEYVWEEQLALIIIVKRKIKYENIDKILFIDTSMANVATGDVAFNLVIVEKGQDYNKTTRFSRSLDPKGMIQIMPGQFKTTAQFELLRFILKKRPDLSDQIWNAAMGLRKARGLYRAPKKKRKKSSMT